MNDLISRKALLAEYDRVHIGEPGKARKLIEDAPAVREWIPVSERLPEKGEDVLVFVFDDYDKWVDTDFLMSNGEWFFENGDRHITHWMPLPEPPKEE